MEQKAEALNNRTQDFALRIIKVVRCLPPSPGARIGGHQLSRSAMSAAANCRAACRARSEAEFLAKRSIVIKETDETESWLELLVDSGLIPAAKLKSWQIEADELVAVFTASRTTAKKSLPAINNQQSTISHTRES
jgi:four helix bundle protein